MKIKACPVKQESKDRLYKAAIKKEVVMKIFRWIALALFAAVLFAGCASTSTSMKWGADSTTSLKGKTEEAVISEYGKPFKKYTTSEGVKVLEYRRSAKDGSALNSAVAVFSFGMLSGENSAYADVLKIYLVKGKVTKATFEENVQVLTTPTL
jgi:hypothetical protein